ncbi:MAG: helix-turn-helix domain-containing protein [Pseudomonadota bacterium]
MTAPAFAWMPMSAFTDRRLGARDLRVLGVLYAHAGAERTCWPAVATLAELTGIDRRDVQRTIRRLEVFGWLTVEVGGGRASSSRYRLHSGAATGPAERAGDSTAGESPQTAGEPPAVSQQRAGDSTAVDLPQTAGGSPAESSERAGDLPQKGRVICHEKAGDLPARTYQNIPENIKPLSCASAAPSAFGNDTCDLLGDPEATPQARGESSEAARMGDFAGFWEAYPRRRGKADARKAWQALKPDAALLERILVALAQARASPDWRREGGRFIPYPATWLRRRGWEDELEPDIEPLPADGASRHGEGQRINGTLAALDSLFRGGQDHAEHDISDRHGVPVSRLWH